MRVKIPDNCDLFPYAATLPANLIIDTDVEELGSDADVLRVRREAGGQSAEDVYSYIPSLGQSMALPIPHIKGACDSRLVVTAESKGKVVSRFEADIKGFKGDRIILGEEMTADSIFVRSLPGSPLLPMGDFFKDIGGPIRGSDDGLVSPPQAAEILSIFQRYFDSFNVTEQRISGGFADVTAVEEAMLYKTGSPYTIGILFLGLAQRLGLNPIVFMSEGRCFIGLEVSMEIGSLRDVASTHVIRVLTSTTLPIIRSFVHRCIVVEVGGDKNTSKNIEDSFDYCFARSDWDGRCCYSDEIEKLAMFEEMMGRVEKENSHGERFHQEDGGPRRRRAADPVRGMRHQ